MSSSIARVRRGTPPFRGIQGTRPLADDRMMSGFACDACKDGVEPPFPFTMAFQPIVDVEANRVYAYEALVRGPNGESAQSILAQLTDQNRYAFDQQCRVKAITLAARLRLAQSGAMLSINFIPGAVYSPAACIQLTLRTAIACSFPADHLIFEITEAEEVRDRAHLRGIVDEYRKRGFKVALDDFGAAYCGLNLLADFPPDIIKLDMDLTRNLHQRPTAIAIVKSMVALARTLDSKLIAEGIETYEEYEALRDCGISLIQGYLFARPAIEALPPYSMPVERHLERTAQSTLQAPLNALLPEVRTAAPRPGIAVRQKR